MRVELLGGFVLRLGDRPAHQPQHVQRLLAFLALQRRPLQRAFVSGRLWPELSQQNAFGCLRTTLWRLGGSSRLVEATSTHLALGYRVVVDADELESCADAVLRRKRKPAAEQLERLVGAEDLLPDWYDDWVLDERERLAQLRLLALEAAADALIGMGAYGEGTLAAAAAVRADPLRESAMRLLVRLHIAAGNPAEAVREYRAFRDHLRSELGLEPSARLQELVRELE
jgi:DNA-binding SARP family transcriptional activator